MTFNAIVSTYNRFKISCHVTIKSCNRHRNWTHRCQARQQVCQFNY